MCDGETLRLALNLGGVRKKKRKKKKVEEEEEEVEGEELKGVMNNSV